jgi:hypothetical protein
MYILLLTTTAKQEDLALYDSEADEDPDEISSSSNTVSTVSRSRTTPMFDVARAARRAMLQRQAYASQARLAVAKRGWPDGEFCYYYTYTLSCQSIVCLMLGSY